MSVSLAVLLSAILVAVASWVAWRPAKPHPASPIRIRGIFRWVNVLGRTYESVFKRPFYRLDPREFEPQLRAVKKAEHELYGSPDTNSEINGLRALFQGWESAEAFPSTLGKLLLTRTLRRSLRHRQQIVAYVRSHPEIREIAIHRPLIITGMPRSGTTFLQRLMATDPRARSPQVWLMAIDPSPKPPTEDQIATQSDPRLKALQKEWKNTLISPNKERLRKMSHSSYLTEVDEESGLMGECMWHNIGMTGFVGRDKSYQQWVLDDKEDKSYIYRYLKVWLQIQSSVYAPESHWLLKTPAHSVFLHTLAGEFPDANLIFIHRNPHSVVPSACRIGIFTYMLRMDFLKYNARQHGQRVLAGLKMLADHLVSFHQSDSKMARRALHVRYEDLVDDPIGTVERIYAHFGYETTEVFRANMGDYLENHPQHKYGKPNYSLDEYGLDAAMVDEALDEYNRTFRRQPMKETVVS